MQPAPSRKYLYTRARRTSFIAFTFGLLALFMLPDRFLKAFEPEVQAVQAATTFNVNSTGDSPDSDTTDGVCNDGAGNCTLRAAIMQANATTGRDTINFAISSGLQTIMPTAQLPVITDPLVIDATTQPGFAGQPVIELNCSGFSANPNSAALQITAGNSVVRGLVINGFSDGGINLQTAGGNLVEGNYIGTNAAGTSSTNSRGNGISVSSSDNLIGGTTPAARNVISATDSHGISIFNATTNNTVQGNYIGTNAAGTAELSNTHSGVFISAPNNTIGGTVAGARNVISGNNVGITIQDASSNGNAIQGNYIGTDAAGSRDLGNLTGIAVFNASGTVIGGTVAGARNVVSGNNFGIQMQGTSDSAVQGNYIGTTAAGSAPLGNAVFGLSISGNVNALIGGTTAGAGNVVASTTGGAANTGNAIQILSSTNTKVQGNYIGTNAAGAGLGNSMHGVSILGDSTSVNSIVGGSEPGAANVIAFNAGTGVLVNTTGTGHTVRANSIFSNGQLGIDLGAAGVTPNDAGDPDTGSNNLQNFPLVRSVSTGGGSTNAQGTLNSAPNASYIIEVFANNSCDASGQGEGQFLLGLTTVNTDASGNAAFNATFPVQLLPGQSVTATATDASGNTSEFSVCHEVDQPGHVQFSASSYTTAETSGSVVITVVRTFGAAETASVNYVTSNGSATANADYTPASGTLFFAPGESMKSFTIQILDDSLGETTETVNLFLSNATGSTLGNPIYAVLNITDDDPLPEVSINNVTINEETANSGANAIFTIRLSEPSSNTVTVRYFTDDDTAQANADYTPLNLQITFTPGQTTKAIAVPIIADTIDEQNERFVVILTNAVNATISNPVGSGTIIDNDPDPGTTGELLITEFRLSAPGGANDEYIEIYNNTNSNIDLRNYSFVFLATSAGSPTTLSFATLQNGFLLTPRSHRLIVNSTGYSLSAYAAGNLFTTGADFFSDNQGIGLRRNGVNAHVDAVGFADDPAEFREGAGLPVISAFPALRPQYSYVRKSASGTPQDTGDNAQDFVLVTTTGEMIAGVPSVLGAPGPQGQTSPVQRNAAIKPSLVDPVAAP
ncbi:MAG TPA: Calx-beta domain-containing protein, partial [Pyrinomonadaceae bacterium]